MPCPYIFFAIAYHRGTQDIGRSPGPGHGGHHLFIFTDNLLMPCPYIINAIASVSGHDILRSPVSRGRHYICDRHQAGHGDNSLFIFTDNLLMPCPYIVNAIALILSAPKPKLAFAIFSFVLTTSTRNVETRTLCISTGN